MSNGRSEDMEAGSGDEGSLEDFSCKTYTQVVIDKVTVMGEGDISKVM